MEVSTVEEEVVMVTRRVLRVHPGQIIAQKTIPEHVEVIQDGDVVVQDEQDDT